MTREQKPPQITTKCLPLALKQACEIAILWRSLFFKDLTIEQIIARTNDALKEHWPRETPVQQAQITSICKK